MSLRGRWRFGDAVRIVRRRGQYMQEAVPVGAGVDGRHSGARRRDRALGRVRKPRDGDVVSPANINGAGQVVIAGTTAAVQRAGERAKALGAKRVIPLAGQCAVPLRVDEAGGGSGSSPSCARSTCRPARAGRRQRRRRAEARRGVGDRRARQAGVGAGSVGSRSFGALRPKASPTYVEVGPGTVLSGLVKKIHKDARVFNFAAPDDLAARWRKRRSRMLDLSGKVAIVTGASRGIGRGDCGDAGIARRAWSSLRRAATTRRHSRRYHGGRTAGGGDGPRRDRHRVDRRDDRRACSSGTDASTSS